MSASDLLKSQVSDGVWQSTFAPAAPVELTNDRFVLGLPNGIIRDKLDGRYRPLVEDAVTEAAGYELTVDFRLILPTLFDPDTIGPREEADIDLTISVAPERTLTSRTAAFEADRGPVARTTMPPSGLAHHSGGNGGGHRSGGHSAAPPNDGRPQPAELAMDQRQRYTFDSFVIGPSNRFAHAAALSVAETPAAVLQPAVRLRRGRAGQDPPAAGHRALRQRVTTRLQGALHLHRDLAQRVRRRDPKNSQADFKRRYREIDVLLVDDIQFMEGKDRSRRSSSTPSTTCTRPTARSCCPPTGRPTPSPPWRTGSGAASRWAWSPTSSRPTSRPGWPSCARRPTGRATSCPTTCSSSSPPTSRQHPRARGRPQPGHGVRRAQPGADQPGPGRAGPGRHHRRPPAPPDHREADPGGHGRPVRLHGGGAHRQVPPAAAGDRPPDGDVRVPRAHRPLLPRIAREFGGRDHTTVIHACDKISALMHQRSQIYDDVMVLEKRVRARAQSGEL